MHTPLNASTTLQTFPTVEPSWPDLTTAPPTGIPVSMTTWLVFCLRVSTCVCLSVCVRVTKPRQSLHKGTTTQRSLEKQKPVILAGDLNVAHTEIGGCGCLVCLCVWMCDVSLWMCDVSLWMCDVSVWIFGDWCSAFDVRCVLNDPTNL